MKGDEVGNFTRRCFSQKEALLKLSCSYLGRLDVPLTGTDFKTVFMNLLDCFFINTPGQHPTEHFTLVRSDKFGSMRGRRAGL